MAWARSSNAPPPPIPWDSWGGGPWKASGCQVTATPALLTISYVMGETPDAWPDAELVFSPALDVSGYARIEFDVRMTSARGLVPQLGLSLLLGTPQGAIWQQDSLNPRLVPGKWVHETVDLSDLPEQVCANLGRFQFFVWNRDFQKAGYRPGDWVIFEFRNGVLSGRRPPTPASLFHAQPLQCVLKVSKATSVWTEPADVKVLPERDLPTRVAREKGVVRLEGAGNEYLDFQVAIRAERALQGVQVSVQVPKLEAMPYSPQPPLPTERVLIRPEGLVTTRAAGSYGARAGPWPDPLLMPGPIDIAAGETRAFWVRLYVPARTPEGVYEGKLGVVSADGKLADAKVVLEVFDFDLPAETHLPTAFNFSFGGEGSHFLDYYPQAGSTVFKRFWLSLAQHRLAPMLVGPSGPPRSASEADLADLEGYADLAEDLKFSHYLSFDWGTPVETEDDRRWVRRITDWWASRGALDKTFVYLRQFDDAGPDRWPDLVKCAKALKAADPRLQRMVTIAPKPELYGAVDVWCPGTPYYNAQIAEERRKEGEKVWWYTSGRWAPGLLIDSPGVSPRALVWLTWTQKVDGLLYSDVDLWTKNPWDDPQMGAGTSGNGDGFLYYPRRPDDPPDRIYESIRLETLRDGMQDYEYSWMLRSRLAAASRNARAKPEAIARARHVLGMIGQVASVLGSDSTAPWNILHEVCKCYDYLSLVRSYLGLSGPGGSGNSGALKGARVASGMIEQVAPGVNRYSTAPEDYAYVRHEVARSIESLPPAR